MAYTAYIANTRQYFLNIHSLTFSVQMQITYANTCINLLLKLFILSKQINVNLKMSEEL